MVEDVGIASLESPGREEEVPVDVGFDVGHVEVGEDHPPRVQRHDGRVVRRPLAGLADLDDRDEAAGLFVAFELPAELLLCGLHLGDEAFAVGAEQPGEDLRVAAGVGRVDDGARVDRGDLHRRVEVRGGGTADDDRDAEPAAFEFLANVDHLVERRGDQPAQADALCTPCHGFIDDALRFDHYAQVADLVAVAGHHHRDDVLADVVHVALDRGDEHLAGRVGALSGALLDVGRQGRYGALHHAGRLDHLRQEHSALAEEPAHPLHGGHQQPVDHLHRAAQRAVTLEGILLDAVGDALEHRVVDPLGERSRAPGVGGLCRGCRSLFADRMGILREPLRGVGPAAEEHVFDPLEQFGFDLVVDAQHLRIDDAHVHAGADGVVEKSRMHRLAHGVVAAEGEREVRDAARDLRVGQVLLDPARGVDECFGIAVVFGNARGDGQHVGVEDDLLGRESVFGQQAVGAFGHLDLAFEGVGLSPLVEEHDHSGGSVAPDGGGPAQELRFALLERDGVHDGLALRHLESGLEHLPLRRVDHRRHAGDLGFRGHQVEERAHGRRPVDQSVVHADIDDLRPGLDLGAGHREGLLVAAFADEPCEAGRSGDVRALADVDEVGLGNDPQRLQTAQHGLVACFGERTRGVVADDLRQFEDVGRGGAAAAAHDIDQSAAHVFAHVLGEHRRGLVVAAHDVRQSGVGVCRDARFGHGAQPLEVGEQLPGPEGAVESDGEQPGVRHRDCERLDGLARERAAAGVGQRARDHDRHGASPLGAERIDGPQGGLGVERVEDGLDEQDVRPAVEQAAGLFAVGVGQLAEGHLA